MTENRSSGVLGQRLLRREDPALLTGEAKYTNDLHLPGALHLAVLRSPYAHARIRSVDPGATGLSGSGLQSAGRFANDVWKFEGTRNTFFQRFAEGIRKHTLRARVVKAGPPALAQAASDRERAELYLRFADKGSKVSFDKVPDLTPDQFQQFLEYVPD